MRKIVFVLIALFMTGTVFTGCDSFDSSPTANAGGTGAGPHGGGGGATPGGSQDFSYIRDLIDDGRVPQADNFLVEGIYSEYDLPIYGEDPEEPFVIRTAHGYSAEHGIPGGGLYAQIGLSSNIDIENFHRDPLNLSVVVDKSGSMIDRIGLVRTALNALIDKLNPNDLLSIVLFNGEMSVLLQPSAVTDKATLKVLINSIQSDGRTNIETGLLQGYAFVRNNLEQGDRTDRVMLLTDAHPNTGNTAPGNFKEIVNEGAEAGIGLIGYGVGVIYDQDLMDFIATVKLATYNYISSNEDIGDIFDDDFKFIFSPLAVNMKLKVEPTQWFDCTAAYGFPGEDMGAPEFEVSTVFLSRNRGALMLKFSPVNVNYPILLKDEHIADVSLSYYDAEGNYFDKSLEVKYTGDNVLDTDDSYFEQEGVRLTIALTREVVGLIDICTDYWEKSKQCTKFN